MGVAGVLLGPAVVAAGEVSGPCLMGVDVDVPGVAGELVGHFLALFPGFVRVVAWVDAGAVLDTEGLQVMQDLEGQVVVGGINESRVRVRV